ncbi:MAG: hypothetical protein CMM03_04805 [Rhodopirellula sp.]|nr:hypothetical protein [Rhodopirellula sp.]
MNKMRQSIFLGTLLIGGMLSVSRSEEMVVGLPSMTIEKLFNKQEQVLANPEAIATPQVVQQIQSELAGEDIGQAGEDSQLLTIKLQMARHLELMEHRLSGETVDSLEPLQFDIMQRMKSLMKQTPTNQISLVGATPSEGLAGQQAGIGTSGESTDPETEPLIEPTGDPIEDQWNRLPRSIKTPLRQASANPFLPGYENLLEQFYLKLNRR